MNTELVSRVLGWNWYFFDPEGRLLIGCELKMFRKCLILEDLGAFGFCIGAMQ